jgi:hypothetical protein
LNPRLGQQWRGFYARGWHKAVISAVIVNGEITVDPQDVENPSGSEPNHRRLSDCPDRQQIDLIRQKFRNRYMEGVSSDYFAPQSVSICLLNLLPGHLAQRAEF